MQLLGQTTNERQKSLWKVGSSVQLLFLLVYSRAFGSGPGPLLVVKANSCEGELNTKQGRAKAAEIRKNSPASLHLPVTTSNHEALQTVMAAHPLHLPKLVQVLGVTLGPLESRSKNGIHFARDFRGTSVRENGEGTKVGERLKEP